MCLAYEYTAATTAFTSNCIFFPHPASIFLHLIKLAEVRVGRLLISSCWMLAVPEKSREPPQSKISRPNKVFKKTGTMMTSFGSGKEQQKEEFFIC